MCLHLGFGQAHTNYTQINTLGRLILTTLFYFSYASHKPCSLLLLFLISIKKGNNLRWLKVQETFNFRMAIILCREPDLVDLFFLMSECIIIWSTRGCLSLSFLYLSHHRSSCEAGLGCCSEAVALQAHNPWGICSAYSCAVVVGLTGM